MFNMCVYLFFFLYFMYIYMGSCLELNIYYYCYYYNMMERKGRIEVY